ncbi:MULTISPECIES: preprotein translocase subunit YajC [unclassified Oleiphilus]|uniref:preprotein translocase subunit YajC n=1 Tax=unclassified Oleiphilus TaxID=2631174 RepID=UPI0009EE799E|nr:MULTISPECIES: preprotein translocase subunit YajC [unclassified Oleiphilus]MCH2157832.1 preprotein translocase subunit YajC [Oleiphilaceae bacterium]
MSTLIKQLSLLVLMVMSGAAYAEGAAQPGEPSALMQLIFFGGFILIFYFLMWRPQSKRAKEHKNLVASLNKGDEIVTNGGIAGKITKVSDDFVSVEVSEGVELKIQKVAVSSALPKGTLKGI